jgi:hypothetical protein
MADGLQTLTAAITVTQLAWNLTIFFRDVQNADVIARRLYQKTGQLHKILQDVEAVLRQRQDQRNATAPFPNENQIEENIHASLGAIRRVLQKIDRKVRDLNGERALSLSSRAVARLQFTLKQPAITKHESDLDTQIQALQTSLGALQL